MGTITTLSWSLRKNFLEVGTIHQEAVQVVAVWRELPRPGGPRATHSQPAVRGRHVSRQSGPWSQRAGMGQCWRRCVHRRGYREYRVLLRDFHKASASTLEPVPVFGAWPDSHKLGALGLLKASFRGLWPVQTTQVRTARVTGQAPCWANSRHPGGLLRVPGI